MRSINFFGTLATTVLLASIYFLPEAGAQDWAKSKLEKSPRHLEWVDVQSKQHKVKCFVAYPEVKSKAAAVLVIHEIFGLTDWVRTVADQLAAKGYIAICPDLLSGSGPKGGGTMEIGSDDRARVYVSQLKPETVTEDLDAAANYVSKLPACNGKLTVTGFCWGGTQSFNYAAKNKNLKASYVFYGTGPDSKEKVVPIACPVYGFYAENDARVGATIPKTEALMKEARKTFQPVTYTGATHGFMRVADGPNANDENKKAAKDAWARWEGLLKKL